MKTNLYLLLFMAIAFLVANCEKSGDEPQPGNEPDSLPGKIVFQKVTSHTLKVATANSMHNSTSYGDAMIYTRPVWSDDGSRFAAFDLLNAAETGSSSVFALKIADTQNETHTSREIGSSTQIDLNGSPAWSPDGTTIAFLVAPYNKIIYLNTQNGDTVQTEFSDKISGDITALAWHPDGDIAINILFRHDFQNDNGIWLIEPFSTTLKEKIASVTEIYGIEFLDWNKAGSALLLSDSSYNDIYILITNTGVITPIPNLYGLAPCWSADGKYIMYTGISEHNGSALVPGLFVSDVNGSFEKLLITDAGYSDWH
ncbi:hypothetical protein GM418_05805 [Maribellus comscasis]|uniref:Uncharacterized protein n=1 Tax=Maribellus comscasis TaxID=2681766 RepID=A0A6I6JQ94_9BACT|nr:PD40 domain-containing protein [Maribellus comscasis]QGY43190.1 hypothetical protein GM418_05805 [Maribellus comscasis]